MMLKKLTAVLLVLFGVLTLPAFSAEEEFPENPVQPEAEEAISFLNALDLIDFSISDGAKPISRAEFITAVYRMNGFPEPEGVWSGQPCFSDVPPEASCAIPVYTAKSMNLISGFSDGTFRPEESITAAEAMTVLIRLLGYGYQAEALGGYPAGYYAAASDLRLLRNYRGSYREPLLRAEAAILFLNALHIDLTVQTSVQGDGIGMEVKKGVTLLTQNFRIHTVQGVVDGVDITNLRGDNTTPPRRISVAGVLISAGDLPVYDNLGYFVDAYYKETEDGGSKQLVYLSKKANKNQETILKAEDVTSIENGTVKAEDERGKTVSCRYESFAAILYNGTATTAAFNTELLQDKTGTLKLLDNNGDNTADIVFIDVYENYVVGKKDSSAWKIYDYYDSSKQLTLDTKADEPYVLLYDEKGEETSFGKIGDMAVLSVSASLPDAPQTLIKAYLSNQKVTGVLQTITEDTNACFVNVDGKEIALTPLCLRLARKELQLGTAVEIGLDKDGQGAYVKPAPSDREQFGYLMALQQEEGLDEGIRVKLMDARGNFGVYDLSDRLKIDDVAYKNYPDSIKTVLNRSAKAISGDIPAGCVAQAVRYTLDANGAIDYIDTVFNTPDGILGTPANLSGKNKLFMVPYENLNFKINARSLGGKILIPKTATVFRLPLPNDLTVDCMDEELYEIANGSYFGDNNNYTGVAYYSRDDIAGAELITIKNDGKGSWGSTETPFSFFIKSVKAIDSEGDALTKVYFSQYGKERTLFCKEDITFTASNAQVFKPEDMRCGDMFRYMEGMSGYLTAFNLIYRPEDDTFYSTFGTDVYDAQRLVKGYVYGAYADGFKFKVTDNPADLAHMDGMEVVRSGSFPVMIYDSSAAGEAKRLKQGSLDDLIGFDRAGSACSRIVIQQRYCEPISLYIVR